jgi:hypothetical protein
MDEVCCGLEARNTRPGASEENFNVMTLDDGGREYALAAVSGLSFSLSCALHREIGAWSVNSKGTGGEETSGVLLTQNMRQRRGTFSSRDMLISW